MLALVIAVLIVVFGYQARVVQGQGELAGFKSTLGAMRTALVLQHLQQGVANKHSVVASTQRNPFRLMERPPANYAGEAGAALAQETAPGKWVFDTECICVGYAPLFGQWLDSASGDTMVWFRVSAPPGPLRLLPKEPYFWQGKAME